MRNKFVALLSALIMALGLAVMAAPPASAASNWIRSISCTDSSAYDHVRVIGYAYGTDYGVYSVVRYVNINVDAHAVSGRRTRAVQIGSLLRTGDSYSDGTVRVNVNLNARQGERVYIGGGNVRSGISDNAHCVRYFTSP